MQVSDLVVGNLYEDVTFPGEVYRYTGPDEKVIGYYSFVRVDKGATEGEGILCHRHEVESDITPIN